MALPQPHLPSNTLGRSLFPQAKRSRPSPPPPGIALAVWLSPRTPSQVRDQSVDFSRPMDWPHKATLPHLTQNLGQGERALIAVPARTNSRRGHPQKMTFAPNCRRRRPIPSLMMLALPKLLSPPFGL